MLSSTAGVAIHQTVTEMMMKSSVDMGPQVMTSEYSEDSGNSWITGMTLIVNRSTEDFNNNQYHRTSSKTSEYNKHLTDSLERMDLQHDSENVTETKRTERHGDCMVWNRECREHLTDSCEEPITKNTDFQVSPLQQGLHDSTPHFACKGDYSKSSTHSPKCVKCIGNNVSVSKFSWFKSMSQIVGLTVAWHQNKVGGSSEGANIVSNSKTSNSVH